MPSGNSYTNGSDILPIQHLPQTDRRSPASDSGPSIFLLLLAGAVIPAALAIGLAIYNPLVVVGAIAGILGMILILARPYWGVLFFVTLLYTRPEEIFPELRGMHFTLIVALTAAVGMTFSLLQQRATFARSPVLWSMFGYVIVTIASALTHNNTVDAALDMLRLLLIALLVLNLVRSPQQHRGLVSVVIGLSTFLAGYSTILFFSGHYLDEQGFHRAMITGIFNDPNDLASALVAGIALALSRVEKKRPLASTLYTLLTVGMIATVFLTGSRGGFIALLFIVVLFFWQIIAKHKGVAILLLMMVIGLYGLGSHGHMGNFDSHEKSVNNRFKFWITGVHELMGNPALGDGYLQFPEHNGGRAAHNTLVQCFAESGFIGYCCFTGMIYFCYKSDRRIRERLKAVSLATPEPVNEVRGARIAFAGYLAASFWLAHAYSPVLYLLMCLPLTAQNAAIGEVRVATDGTDRVKDIARIVAIAVGSVLFIWEFSAHMK